VKAEGASCCAAVKGLGGSEENCLQWKDIYRNRGGKCSLRISYCSEEACEAVVRINGSAHKIEFPACKDFSRVELPVRLRAGANVISIESPEKALPAVIDAISIL